MAGIVATPDAKQHFDDIYVMNNPVGFKQRIMEQLSYVSDNYNRIEFDRLVLPEMQRLAQYKGSQVKVVDMLCCFGNTTMACVNGMTTGQIMANWADGEVCEKVIVPRRFDCHVTGLDISQGAVDYGKRAGIYDLGIQGDLNSKAGIAKAVAPLKECDCLISTAALVYLSAEAVEQLISSFAEGPGEGYAIVNFLNPFEPEKTDTMKQILLKHLEFVGSRSSRHRKMSEKEIANYDDYGEWALLEIWTLRRRNRERVGPKVIALESEEDKRAQDYYDSEDAYHFYKEVWGGDNLHVGIYNEEALKAPLGPERIKLASEVAIRQLMEKQPPKAGDKVIDMGSAYGGLARYIASTYGAFVSCVDLSAKENARNREMTKQAGLEHVVSCPGERSFTATGEADESFDLVVSEDSFLHAGQYRRDSIIEASRVLKVGGYLVFTDVMQSDSCKEDQMAPVYKRINLDDMGSPGKYKQWAKEAGLEFIEFEDLTENIAKHYGTVKEVLQAKAAAGALKGKVSDEYIQRMSSGLQSWVDQAGNGNIAWGIQVYKKTTSKGPPKGSKWEDFSVERWQSAVYVNMSYFGDLFADTTNFISDIAKHMKLRGMRVSLCEVGCGTGEFLVPLAPHFRTTIGIDFNSNFIEYCKRERIPKHLENRLKFVCGDATELCALMQRVAPPQFHADTKIVCCVGNTIGIIPPELKRRVYKQMTELAGPDGVIVVVYWNARWFGDACQNFYHANPQLCGPFTGEAIDFTTTTLTTGPPTNYRSHWTGIAEARQVIAELGLEEIVVEERGKGVLLAARQNVHTPSTSPALMAQSKIFSPPPLAV